MCHGRSKNQQLCTFYLSLPVIVLADFILSFHENEHKSIASRLREDGETPSSLTAFWWLIFLHNAALGGSLVIWQWLKRPVPSHLWGRGPLVSGQVGDVKPCECGQNSFSIQKTRILIKYIASNISQKIAENMTFWRGVTFTVSWRGPGWIAIAVHVLRPDAPQLMPRAPRAASSTQPLSISQRTAKPRRFAIRPAGTLKALMQLLFPLWCSFCPGSLPFGSSV